MVAYWLFVRHGKAPGEYFRHQAGERAMMRLFLSEHLRPREGQ